MSIFPEKDMLSLLVEKYGYNKEEIPYQVSLVGTRKPTQAEREYGIALAQNQGPNRDG